MTAVLDQRAVEDPTCPGPSTTDREDERFRLWELLPVGVLGVLVPLVFFGMWPLDRPVVYTQDAFQHLAIGGSADWTGTPGFTSLLNAPHGMDWQAAVPTGTERIHVVVLGALARMTGDVLLAMNLTVLLGVATTIVTAYAVIRWLGAGRVLAAGGSVAFAMSPVLTDRLAAGHLYLFALFPVALGTYLAVLGSRPWSGRSRKAMALPALAVVVIAVSSVYYATFTVILVAVLGAVTAVRARSWRRLLVPAAVVVGLALAMGLTLAPDLVARHGSATAGTFTRSIVDNDRYGLRIAQMLLPLPQSRVPALARLGERAYWVDGVGDYGVSIGLIASAGLVAIAWSTTRWIGRSRDETDRLLERLMVLVGGSVAFASVGGLGFLVATLGFTQTRVWSRMAAFVAFSSIAGLALVIERRWGRHPHLAIWVCALVAISLLEHPLVPDRHNVDAMVREDRTTVASLRRALPHGAAVAELPAVPFPDDLGSDRLLAPSLLAGSSIRFSAGAFKGGTGDWQQGWLTDDVGTSTEAAALAGFDGLLLQRSHHLWADGDGAVVAAERASGEPAWRSSDGTWAWVDLRPLRRRLTAEIGAASATTLHDGITRPLGVTFVDWLSTTWGRRDAIQLLGAGGGIRVRTLDGDRAPFIVSFDVGAAEGAEVAVSVPGSTTQRLKPGPDGQRVTVRVDDPASDTVITVDGGPAEERFDRATPASVWIGRVRVRDTRAQELFDRLPDPTSSR